MKMLDNKTHIEQQENENFSILLDQINDVNKSIGEEYGVDLKEIVDIYEKDDPLTTNEKESLNNFFSMVIKKDVSEKLIETNSINEYDNLIRKSFSKVAGLEDDINQKKEKQFFTELNLIYLKNNKKLTPELTSKFQNGLEDIYNFKFEEVDIPENLDNIEFQDDLSDILNEVPPILKCPIYNDHLGENHNIRQSFARYLELKVPNVLDENNENIIRSKLEKVILKVGTLQKLPFLVATIKMYDEYGMAKLTNEQKNLVEEIASDKAFVDYAKTLPNYQNLDIDERIVLGRTAIDISKKIIDGFAINSENRKSTEKIPVGA